MAWESLVVGRMGAGGVAWLGGWRPYLGIKGRGSLQWGRLQLCSGEQG